MFGFSLNKEVNHFNVLGLSKDTNDIDDNDVKNAYHKLAKEWHPDLNKDKIGAVERFRLIQSSYEAIKTREKRAVYMENLHDSDSWNLHRNREYSNIRRSNYTDVSGDFNKAYGGGSARANATTSFTLPFLIRFFINSIP